MYMYRTNHKMTVTWKQSWATNSSRTCSRSWTRSWSWPCIWTCKAPNFLPLLVCLLFSPWLTECASNDTLLEIGRAGEYKDLICNVSEESQCKVIWKKEDVHLLLTNGRDEHISCENSCRTLKFTSLDLNDAGYYSCHAAGGCEQENLPQRFHLRVEEDEESQAAVVTQYQDCQDKHAHPGEDVTFCCICKVSHVSPSVYTSWYDANYDFVTESETAESYVSYDSETEVPSCITLHNVNETFEGNYTMQCLAPQGNVEKTLVLLVSVESRLWIAVVSGVSALVAMTILTGMVYRLNSVEIRLALKDRFGKQEKNDGKLYDAYISYFWSNQENSPNPDREYALDLEKRLDKLGYTVCLPEIDFLPGNETGEEIVQSLKRSRRYIILLSPQFLQNRYVYLETAECLDIIKQQKKNIIPVFIQDVAADELKKHTALDHIISTHPRLDWRIFDESRSRTMPIRTLSMENGNTIEMEGSTNSRTAPKLKRKDIRVWKTLRLQMPPIPRGRDDVIEEPLSSVETDSLIRHQVSQEGSTNGENCETTYPSNVII